MLKLGTYFFCIPAILQFCSNQNKMIMKKKKNFTAVLLLATIANNAHAQVVNKGDIMAGLNISGQNTSFVDSTGGFRRGPNEVNYAPFFSYGIGKNQTLGTYMLLNKSNGSNFNFSKYNHDFAVGIFTRRYFPISRKLYAYGQVDLQYASIGNTYSNGKFVSKTYAINLSGGIGYQFNKRLSFELGLNNLGSAIFGNSKGILNNGQPSNSKINQLNFRGITERNGIHVGFVLKF
jgi:hypothetical protein